MTFFRFKVPEYNQHYVGTYSEIEMDWRRVCAVEKANNIQFLLKDRKVTNVLEVGCGTGAVISELASRGVGSRHEGVDIEDVDLHKDSNANTINLRIYDGENLPYPDNHFDLVYASHVIEHVLEPRQLINEMNRVARSLIYLEIPCELHLRTTYAALQNTLDIGHINAYTPESFLLLLRTTNLNVVEFNIFDHTIDVHSFFGGKIRGVAKMVIRKGTLKVSPHLASRIFTYHCGALASKID